MISSIDYVYNKYPGLFLKKIEIKIDTCMILGTQYLYIIQKQDNYVYPSKNLFDIQY